MNKTALLVLAFILLPLAYAQSPPFQTSAPAVSLDIDYPKITAVGYNENFTMSWHVQNITKLLTNSQVSCYFHLYDKYGRHIIENSTPSFSGRDFIVLIPASNLSYLGHYYSLIECNSSNQAGFASLHFDATREAVEIPEAGQTAPLLAPILLMLFMAAFLFGIAFMFNNAVGKIIFVGLAFVVLISTLLFTIVTLEQTSSSYSLIIDGVSTLWFVVKILAGIGLILLVVFTLVVAYWSWLGKKGYRD